MSFEESNNKTILSSVEKKPNQLHFRKIIASSAIGLAGFTIGQITHNSNNNYASKTTLERVTKEAATLANVNESVILEQNLHNPPEISNTTKRVTAEQINLLKKATVMIISRPRDSAAPWQQTCTGIKGVLNGNYYIQSAVHCFKPYYGFTPSGAQYDNILPKTFYDYAIGTRGSKKEFYPIATVAAVAVDINGNDTALIKLSNETTTFQDIPAIPLTTKADATTHTPGEQVGMVGLPISNYGNVVIETGTYLGEIVDPNIPTQHAYVVGTISKTSAGDACYFGGSGSSFIFPSGQISGVATARSGKNEKDISGQINDNVAASESYRLKLEQSLNENLSKFNVLCSYTIPPNHTYSGLVDGFNISIN